MRLERTEFFDYFTGLFNGVCEYGFTLYKRDPVQLEKKILSVKAYIGKVVQFDGIFQKAFVFRIPSNQLYNLLRVIMEFIYRARLKKNLANQSFDTHTRSYHSH